MMSKILRNYICSDVEELVNRYVNYNIRKCTLIYLVENWAEVHVKLDGEGNVNITTKDEFHNNPKSIHRTKHRVMNW
jgi:hypothetical protein